MDSLARKEMSPTVSDREIGSDENKIIDCKKRAGLVRPKQLLNASMPTVMLASIISDANIIMFTITTSKEPNH